MAFDLSGLTAWADETSFATNFYTEALMANDAVPFIRTYGELLNGVKADTVKLPNLEQTVTLADGDNCTFSDGGTTTITQTTLTMKNAKFQGELCIRDLESYFTAVALPAGQNYDGIGQVENVILSRIQEQCQKAIANEIWGGGLGADTAIVPGLYEFLNDSSATATSSQTLTSGGVAGTDAAGAWNVVEGLVAAAMADADLGPEVMSGNVVIVMSPLAKFYYMQNFRKLFGDNSFGALAAPDMVMPNGVIRHQGTAVEIHVQNGLQQSPDLVILTRKRNLVVGFDLESDTTGLQVGFDQYKEKMWWKIRFKMGTAIRSVATTSLLFNGTVS